MNNAVLKRHLLILAAAALAVSVPFIGRGLFIDDHDAFDLINDHDRCYHDRCYFYLTRVISQFNGILYEFGDHARFFCCYDLTVDAR